MATKTGVEVWRSLKDDIEIQIIKGIYKGGDKLPSVVELMEMYSVSRGTVQKALSALNSEDIVTSRGIKGIFVMPFVREKLLRKHREELCRRYKEIAKEAQELGINISDITETESKQ